MVARVEMHTLGNGRDKANCSIILCMRGNAFCNAERGGVFCSGMPSDRGHAFVEVGMHLIVGDMRILCSACLVKFLSRSSLLVLLFCSIPP